MSQVILRELKLNSAVKYVAREGFVNNFPITFAYDNPTQLQVFVGFKRVPSWELKMENGLPSVVLPEDLKIDQSITIRRATPADGVPHTYQYKGNAQGGAEFSAKTIDENFEYMSELVAEVEDYNTIAQDGLNGMEEKFEATQDIANGAMRVANEAKDTADSAEQVALGIDGKAQEALDNSVEALGVANDAKTTALGIDGKAQEALDKSTTASQDASNALSIAQSIDGKAQSALDNSSEALVNANTALTVAQGVDGKAQTALDNSELALADINNKRDLDDNVFNGLMTIKSDNDEQGVGVLLQESDGTIRGSLVSDSNGIQITQRQEDGSTQSFTFPGYGEGGEIVTDRTLLESIPIGVVKAYIGETAPNDKWLLCRGQAFSAESYPDLAQLLPDLKIPDLRGVALRGLDANRGFDPNRKLLSYQEDAMQKIEGGVSQFTTFGSAASTKGGSYSGAITEHSNAIRNFISDDVPRVENQTGYPRGFRIDSSLVARANPQNETVMKNVAVNFIIKAR